MNMRNQLLAEAVSPGRSPRVLLAEDDSAMRDLLARTLRRAGYDVVEAKTGDEAFSELGGSLVDGSNAFDLVVSDVRMPGYDGLDLLAWCKHLRSGLPVILITAFGGTAVHDAALRLGAFTIVDKPFDLDDLVILAAAATASPGARSEEGRT